MSDQETVANRQANDDSPAVSARSVPLPAQKTGEGLPATTEARVNRRDFARSMAQLCALKRTAEFSQPAVWAWYAALCVFPAEVLNYAVIRLGLEETRFPDLADLYVECKREATKRGIVSKRWAPNADANFMTRPSDTEIRDIAARLGIPT